MRDKTKKRNRDIQKRKEKLRKIKKNHIGGSVATFLLTALLAVTTITIFSATFIQNSMLDAFRNEEKTIESISEVVSSEADLRYAFDAFRVYHDRFMLDKDGNMLFINGEDTCEREGLLNLGQFRNVEEALEQDLEEELRKNGSDSEADEFTAVLEDYREQMKENGGTEEDDEDEPKYGKVIRYYPDKSDNLFKLGGKAYVNVDIWSALNLFSDYWDLSGGSLKNIFNDYDSDSDEVVSYPYWLSSQINSRGDFIFARAAIQMKRDRLATLFLMFILFCIIMGLMLAIMLINMTTMIISKNRLSKLYFTDMVTKGHNQYWFEMEGEDFLCKGRNALSRCAVLNISFANFRTLSISQTSAESEEMLTDVYKELIRFFGKKSIVAHCSTSNFAVAVNAEDENALRSQLPLLITDLENSTKEHSFTFQIGVDLIEKKLNAHGTPTRRTETDIYEHYNNACTARITLEDSDESGIAFFDDKLLEEQTWINTVNEKQQTALLNEEFLVYYQPKYDPRTDKLRGAEALIRWQSPEFGFVTPNRMIPIFEKNGFITEIDHYMITHVARDQKRWLDEGLECVPVSVNVSRAHFIEPDLAEQIRDMVDKEGAPHELIEIELTESAFFDDKKAMVSTIERLKSYGFAVSMDDFGAGYSSLNSLKDMPLDVLKLDAEFFRGEGSGDRGEIVVSEAIRLAKSLNMRTVAEGVEIKEQVDFLADQGCDMIQGYFYSKPVPPEEFMRKMQSGVSENTQPSAETTDAPEQNETVTLEKPDTAKESENGVTADGDNRL